MGSPPTPNQPTIENALRAGRSRLDALSESASLDAQVLLAHVLHVDRGWLFAHPEDSLSAEAARDWEDALGRLEKGEALPYVLGEWEFFGLSIYVTPDVLIPRPETELLVETALDWLGKHPERQQVVDVGTGSGCIAVALAVKEPGLKVTAYDISEAALRVAARNAERHGVSARIEFLQADLLAGVEGPFDVVCANLPYIPSGRVKGLDVYAREPHIALDGGKDGLAFIGPLLEQAKRKINDGGLILAEIDPGLEDDIVQLAKNQFETFGPVVSKDLEGRARLLIIQT
ncbi:MAG: peptide chain release factor N(5)-glutamine methyltransferase [Chloroflexi bacterium]|nr:peptide chain release factor N(5)-glutamine methyltransferase [Chloroflexota bacterium]